MADAKVSPAGSIFDPDLLSRCISCGFCLPACPTYALTGDEASSPRGRITLMRALESGTLPSGDPTLAEQASFCLGCRACEPVCPAGVQYGELLEQWRGYQWAGRRRPLVVRFLVIAAELPWAHRIAGRLRGAARTPASASGPSLMLGCFRSKATARSVFGRQPARHELQIPVHQPIAETLTDLARPRYETRNTREAAHFSTIPACDGRTLERHGSPVY